MKIDIDKFDWTFTSNYINATIGQSWHACDWYSLKDLVKWSYEIDDNMKYCFIQLSPGYFPGTWYDSKVIRILSIKEAKRIVKLCEL